MSQSTNCAPPLILSYLEALIEEGGLKDGQMNGLTVEQVKAYLSKRREEISALYSGTVVHNTDSNGVES